jgi:dTDP-4-dehydrorhamnose reductase
MIWITGASGMLGQDLCSLARSEGLPLRATDREVDITDEAAVSRFLAEHKPTTLVNCAAYTAVDNAETDPLNFKINALGPQVLGKCTKEAGVKLIHISTDYVLSGAPPAPLAEDAPLCPVNAYGKAKAEGEAGIAQNPEHWILRTAWLYGIHGKNFVKTMLALMETKDEIKVIDDQMGNPTWTVELAHALLAVVKNPHSPGIYHFTGEGITSWHGFAVEIQKQALEMGLLHQKIPVHAVPTSGYPTPARRPLWSALDKTKIKTAFSLSIPAWQDSLRRYLKLTSEEG